MCPISRSTESSTIPYFYCCFDALNTTRRKLEMRQCRHKLKSNENNQSNEEIWLISVSINWPCLRLISHPEMHKRIAWHFYAELNIVLIQLLTSSTHNIGNKHVFRFSVISIWSTGRRNILNCTRFAPTTGKPVF